MRSLPFIVAFVFLLPGIVSASSVVRTGETVTVASDQVVEGDFYGLGGTAAVSGEISDDLLLIGGTATMNGVIGADMFVLGGAVDVHGVVADDLRVVGGTVTVAGEVKGDLLVIARELKVLSTASIGGDILFFGGKAEVAGTVGSDILGTSDLLRVDGMVGGSVDVKTRVLTLGERAEVAGDVSYMSSQEVVRAQDTTVKGKIVRSDVVTPDESVHRTIAISFLITLFAALVNHLIFRTFTDRVITLALDRPFRSFTIGFAVLFLVPIASSVLLLSTLGSIVGMMILFAYFALICLALPLSGIVAGVYGLRIFKRPKTVSVLTVVSGTVVLTLCLYIPFFGSLVIIGLLLLTLGAVVEHGYRLVRS